MDYFHRMTEINLQIGLSTSDIHMEIVLESVKIVEDYYANPL